MSKKLRIKYQQVEVNGEKHKVAMTKAGRRLPLEEKIKIAELVCQMYETDEHTLKECAKNVGIDVKTFFNWTQKYPEISSIYLDADNLKDRIYRHKLKSRAITQAERLIDGYTVELKDVEATKDADGNKTGSKIKVREVLVRPSAKLIHTVIYGMNGSKKDNPFANLEGANPELLTDDQQTMFLHLLDIMLGKKENDGQFGLLEVEGKTVEK